MSSELERAVRDAVYTLDAGAQIGPNGYTHLKLKAVLPPLPPTRDELVERVLETVPGYVLYYEVGVPDTSYSHLIACRALVAYDEAVP